MSAGKPAVFTEEEAAGQGCVLGVVTTFSHNSSQIYRPSCIGAKCQAWRWWATLIDPDDPTKGEPILSLNSYGYCGLAGRPE